MAIVQVSIVPLGTQTPSVGEYVAQAVALLEQEPGVSYLLTPMGTVIEGDLDMVLGMVRKMHEGAFESGAQRLVTTITIDDRRDKPSTMEGKVASVRARLQRQEREWEMVGSSAC